MNAPFVSVVIPVFNEIDSLEELVQRLMTVFATPPFEGSEIVFVDDGSTDGSLARIQDLADRFPKVIRAVSLRKNFGKSLALSAGFTRARGKYIAMMDADLQDHPEEFPRLLAHLEKGGFDAVTGWKKHRHDPASKTFPSRVFNMLLGYTSGMPIHDFNCGIKLFKRECLEDLVLYGHLHRFILILLQNRGFKVGELEVTHSARQFGQSKYGINRIYHGVMDILTVFFLTRYLESPLYFFGFYGACTLLLSIPIGLYFLFFHFLSFFTDNQEFRLHKHPLWLLSPVGFLMGIIMVFFGLLGEMFTYFLMDRRMFRSIVAKEIPS